MNPFLWLSGADPRVLDSIADGDARTSAHRQMLVLGVLITVPAIFGTITMTIVLNQFLHAALPVAMIGGLTWGAAILAIDSFFAMTMRRQDKLWKTLVSAAPRVLLAMLIGLVISECLVLKLFADKIDPLAAANIVLAAKQQRDRVDAERAEVDKIRSKRSALIARANGTNVSNALGASSDYKTAVKEQRRAEAAAAKARSRATCELDGTCGSSKSGAGPAWDAKNSTAASLESKAKRAAEHASAVRSSALATAKSELNAQRPQLNAQIADLARQITKKSRQADADQTFLETAYGGKAGLLDRLEALDQLGRKNGMMLFAHLAIMLLILGLDSAAVWGKLLMVTGKKGPYELAAEHLEASDSAVSKARAEAYTQASEIDAQVIVDDAKVMRDETRKRNVKLAERAADIAYEQSMEYLDAYQQRSATTVSKLVDQEIARMSDNRNIT